MKSGSLSVAFALLAAVALSACGDSGTSGSGGSGSGDAKFRAEEYCFLNADLAALFGVSDCAALTDEQKADLAGHYESSGKAEGRWWNVFAQCSERLAAGAELPCDFQNLAYWKSCSYADPKCECAMNDAAALRQHYLDTGRALGLNYSGVPADFTGAGYCSHNAGYAAVYGPACDDRVAGWHYMLFGKAAGFAYKDTATSDPFADYVPIASEPSFKIIGYAQGGTSGTTWSDAYMAKMTHVVVFGNEVSANGDIVWKGNDKDMLKWWGYWGSKTDTRVMVAIGGWDKSNGFTAMANSASARSNFIAQLKALKDHHVYGVDIDWENDGGQWPYPGAGVNQLLSEMHAALSQAGMKVSIALSSTSLGGFDATGYAAVDWINVMCYDGSNHGTFAKISSCQSTYDGYGWKAKSVIGVPFYANNTAYAAGATAEVLSVSGMAEATSKIKNWGGPGIMFWDMSHDKTDPSTSLLHSIARTAGYDP